MASKRQLGKKLEDCGLGTNTVETVRRIDNNPEVTGVMYIQNDEMKFTTLSEYTSQLLLCRVPEMNRAIRSSVAEITKKVNDKNPIVDRIMDDESVGGVILTNSEGAPILTNFGSLEATPAATYALALRALGELAVSYIKDLDPFDEILAMRIKTKKSEILLSPQKEFSVIVLQNDVQKPRTHPVVKKILS